MKQKYCQSCMMPMGAQSDYGKEADGTYSEDYCSYCYADGKFTGDTTMEEMIAFCVGPMVENSPGMTEETARKMMQETFPKLKRWQ